jgi:hypothetical protein
VVGVDAWAGFWGRQTPVAPALLTPSGQVSWGELAERVRRREIGSGTPVALDETTAEALETLLACARAGALADTTGGGPARRTGGGLATPLLRLPGDLGPDPVELTHHDVEALAVAGIAADGLRPADRVAAVGPGRPVAVLPVLHAGGAVVTGPDLTGVTVLHGHVPAPVAGTDLRRIVVGGPAADELVAGWAAHGVDVVEAYGPAEAAGFALRQPRPGAPLVALPGRRARVVDGRLELAGTGIDGWLRTDRPAVADGAGFRLPAEVGAP